MTITRRAVPNSAAPSAVAAIIGRAAATALAAVAGEPRFGSSSARTTEG